MPPSSASSPRNALRAGATRRATASAIATAIGRSRPDPSLRSSAGARFTASRVRGNSRPLLRIAARTRSRASLTVVAARPTRTNATSPRPTDASTCTGRTSSPASTHESTEPTTPPDVRGREPKRQPWSLRLEEVGDGVVKRARLLHEHHVPRVADDHLARAGNRGRHVLGARRPADEVVLTRDDERRDLQLLEAFAEVELRHIGVERATGIAVDRIRAEGVEVALLGGAEMREVERHHPEERFPALLVGRAVAAFAESRRRVG